MVGISAPCTCTVDGFSGDADVSYLGYTFTGCGAHRGYNYGLGSGAGYHLVWCYVTEPEECESGSPRVPDFLQTKNTLPDWEDLGAAWKACYEGYRCEAWWGSLDGTTVTDEPIVLDAPLDWPDCCALCSKSGENALTSSECVGWSFEPSTGGCQLMSTVSSTSRETDWGYNKTVSGYPGYFEPPVSGCWSRSQYDLCQNMDLGLIIPGCFVSFIGLALILWTWTMESPRSRPLKNLLKDTQGSRLEKARPVEVKVDRFVTSYPGKYHSEYRFEYTFRGTFATRDGRLLEVPSRDTVIRRDMGGAPRERYIEWEMLKVLFGTNLQPLSDPAVAANRLQTPHGVRSTFQLLASRVDSQPLGGHFSISPGLSGTQTRSNPEVGSIGSRFNCLLLIHDNDGRSAQASPAPTVLLVGILGEDRITCVTPALPGFLKYTISVGLCCLFVGISMFTILCVVLLTNEAAQVMASFTFPATNYRKGAYAGLAFCVCIPLAILLRRLYRGVELMRLAKAFPGVAESGQEVSGTNPSTATRL